MSKFVAGAAALCVAGMFALTPAQATERSADGLRGGPQVSEWEVSDHRRRYRRHHRHYHRHYHRRHFYRPVYRPYYYSPYYAYPRPYYRPYYHRAYYGYRPYYRPAAAFPFPFFPFFGFGW